MADEYAPSDSGRDQRLSPDELRELEEHYRRKHLKNNDDRPDRLPSHMLMEIESTLDDHGEGITRYRCTGCGTRFPYDGLLPLACLKCGRRQDSLSKIKPLPADTMRVYCRDCDFTLEIAADDYDRPRQMAEARAELHSAQLGHATGEEKPLDWSIDFDESDLPVDSEADLQAYIEAQFERAGWTAIREVSPHRSSYRADLIVNHDNYGWFGIETKYFDRDGGAKIADAHHQITRKYRGKKYIGNRIDLWAICPFFTQYETTRYPFQLSQDHARSNITRELFNRHGVGFIQPHSSYLKIDFSYSQPWAKVPVTPDKDSQHGRHYENVDIDRIRSYVDEKMDRFDYR